MAVTSFIDADGSYGTRAPVWRRGAPEGHPPRVTPRSSPWRAVERGPPRSGLRLDARYGPSLDSTPDGGRATNESAPSIARGFLFADLRGYSAWVERHGDHAAAALIRGYRDLVRQAVAEHRGAEIKTEGDSFYVAFDSPSAAVRCGLRILELAATSTEDDGAPIPVGIGVHAGETVATDEGFVGSAVNIAARVCAQARAGELLVTDAVRSLTRTYLDVGFQPVGRRQLKGIREPIGLFRVTPRRAGEAVSVWRRLATNRPLVASAVAIPLIVVVALIGGALVREAASGPAAADSSSPAAEPSASAATASIPATPASSADVAFPTEAEAALVRLVPEQDRDACQRADPGDTPVLGVDRIPGEPTVVHRTASAATIDCDLGGIAGPDRLTLWELTRSGIRVGQANPPAIAIAAHGGLVGAAPGTCRERRPTIEQFTFGGISGTLVCYESTSGDAVLMWVYDESRSLFARALRDDRDMAALLDWWEDVGRFIAP